MQNPSLLKNGLQKELFYKGSATGFLTYEEFQRKYRFKTNFLNFYQVLSIIP